MTNKYYEALRDLIASAVTFANPKTVSVRNLEELVKRATPMKIDIKSNTSHYYKDEWYGDVYQCPNCGERCIWNDSNFCMICGQQVEGNK